MALPVLLAAEKIILLKILVFRFQGQALHTTAQEENQFSVKPVW